MCMDTVGSFFCVCDPGFTGNGVNCSSTALNNRMETSNIFLHISVVIKIITLF